DGEVTYNGIRVGAGVVLANVAPYVLAALVEERATKEPASRNLTNVVSRPRSASTTVRPEGAQVKTNLVLSRLPKLKDTSVGPAAAFGGTFHINETWTQLQRAYDTAAGGGIPDPLPCEIYCHSLTDPSILSPELQASGAQTITVFGLHVPDRLATETNNETLRAELQKAVLASLDSVLAEPIESLVLRDANDEPAIETRTTLDLEHSLAMPGGNIFHGPLSWPFAEDDDPLWTPAQRWGVESGYGDRILLCGAGARRGGAVSGLGGHNAAMAVLEG
ncbi:MAG: NAD(P)/FAD-dependent oxidoreductase, partial [Rhodoglobus sp.]